MPRLRRVVLQLAVAACSLCALLLALRLTLSDARLLRHLTPYLTQTLGAPVSIDAMRLRLHAGLDLTNVTVGPAQGFTDPLVKLRSLRLRWDVWRLLRMAVHIKEIRLEGLELAYEQNATGDNVTPFSSQPHKRDDKPVNLPVHVTIDEASADLRSVSVRTDEDTLVVRDILVTGHFDGEGAHAEAALNVSTQPAATILFRRGAAAWTLTPSFGLDADITDYAAFRATSRLAATLSCQAPCRMPPVPLGYALALKAAGGGQNVDVEHFTAYLLPEGAGLRLSAALQLVDTSDAALPVRLDALSLNVNLTALAPLIAAFLPAWEVGGRLTVHTSPTQMGARALALKAATHLPPLSITARADNLAINGPTLKMRALSGEANLSGDANSLRFSLDAGAAALASGDNTSEDMRLFAQGRGKMALAPWKLTDTDGKASLKAARIALPQGVLNGLVVEVETQNFASDAPQHALTASVALQTLKVGDTTLHDGTARATLKLGVNLDLSCEADLRVGSIHRAADVTRGVLLTVHALRQGDALSLQDGRVEVAEPTCSATFAGEVTKRGEALAFNNLRFAGGPLSLEALEAAWPSVSQLPVKGALTVSGGIDGVLDKARLGRELRSDTFSAIAALNAEAQGRGYAQWAQQVLRTPDIAGGLRLFAATKLQHASFLRPPLGATGAEVTLTIEAGDSALKADMSVAAETLEWTSTPTADDAEAADDAPATGRTALFEVAQTYGLNAYAGPEGSVRLRAAGAAHKASLGDIDLLQVVAGGNVTFLATDTLQLGDAYVSALGDGLTLNLSASIHQPLGRFVHNAFRAPGLPGVMAELQATGAVRGKAYALLPGGAGEGSAALALTLSLADGTIDCAGGLQFADLSLRLPNFSVEQLSGSLPLRMHGSLREQPGHVVVLRNVPSDGGVLTLETSGDDVRNRAGRPIYDARLRPYRPVAGLTVKHLAAGDVVLDDISLEGRVGHGVAFIDRFSLRALSGDVVGDMALQLSQDNTVRGDLRLKASHLSAAGLPRMNLPAGPASEMSADLGLSFLLGELRRELTASVNVTRLGAQALDRFLLALDPQGKDQNLADTRHNLRYVRIQSLALWVAYENLNMDINYDPIIRLPFTQVGYRPIPRELLRRYAIGDSLDVYVQPLVDQTFAKALGWQVEP